MKKVVSTVLVCVMLISCMLTLASCSKMLMGKYEIETIVGDTTYEFDPFGKVTRTYEPPIGDDVVDEGKYKINDDGDKITFTFGDDTEEHKFATVEKNGVKYIEIDGLSYEKVD